MFHQLNILAGFVLDLLFGDPYSFPHPVRFVGKYIDFLERHLRKLKSLKIAGIVLVLIVVPTSYLMVLYISAISVVLEIILIYTIFSTKSLADEAMIVYNFLDSGDIHTARKHIGFLVSRDTDDMQEKDIIKAAVETVAENIVDGIISPMFYLFLGGAALGMAYKAGSTLDSMVGYKNERYMNFGWASARLDDVLNYIPARITAFIIPVAAFFCRLDVKNSARIVLRDRRKHGSPNSGYPEAAVAGALGCQLGGPAKYFGKMVDKPYIGDQLKEIDKEDILKSIKLMYITSFLALVLGSVVIFIISLLK